MAKFIYGMAQSLDGFVANAAGEITVPAPDEALHRYFNGIQRQVAVSLNGRRMYEVMRYWETADKLPESQPWDVEFARVWQETPKVVVSTTLTEIGPNATLIRDNVDAALRALKADTDGIVDVAGPTLAATCSRLGLIDEYRFYFHPMTLGSGQPFLAEGLALNLKYLGTEHLPQDVVMLRYGPA